MASCKHDYHLSAIQNQLRVHNDATYRAGNAHLSPTNSGETHRSILLFCAAFSDPSYIAIVSHQSSLWL